MTRRKKVRAFAMLLATLAMLCSHSGRHPRLAFADQGSVTITQQHNERATYDAYLVFRADIDERDQASNVTWPNDETKEAVLAFLDESGYPSWLEGKSDRTEQHDLAQNAAEYVAAMITGSEGDLGAATSPRSTTGRSFANALARGLTRRGIRSEGVASAGEPFEGEEGLWLFVTTQTTIDAEGESGTGPIWLPLGGSTSQVLEKTDIPTLRFEVWEDSKEGWGKVADANRGQSIACRLIGTLPADLGSFSTYHHRFDVSLPEGVDLDAGQGSDLSECIKVSIGEREVALDGSGVTATYEKGHLAIDFADLKSDRWEAYDIDGNTVITAVFNVLIDDKAMVGAPGNTCTAQITYTGDPISDVDARSEAATVTVFTYQMSLVKVDKQTKDKLKGAAFSIQVAQENSEAESRGLYVQEDGSLGTDAHSFTTNEEGTLTIGGIDEGIYVVNELTAPQGYKPIGDAIKLVVESELSDVEQSLKAFRSTSSSKAATLVEAPSDKGALTLTVENERQLADAAKTPTEALAQTGVGPVAGSLVLAGAFVMLLANAHRPRQ